MPLDYSNPNTLKFLKENYEKSQERRMIWFLKNQDKLAEAAILHETGRYTSTAEVLRAPVELYMPSLSLNHKYNMINRRQKPLQDGIVRGVSQLTIPRRRKGREPIDPICISDLSLPEPIMKSVNSIDKNILYKALPQGGRLQYLDKRKRMLPEDKYNFCETSSNVIGWRLYDSKLSRQPTDYGRVFAFERDVNSRSGPQPDPDYYQKPPNVFYSQCFG